MNATGTTRTRQQKTRTVLAALTTPVAVIGAGALIYQASWSAFTATTSNDDNTWGAAGIALTDDDSGAAAFTVDDILPGNSGEQCIKVTATSTVPGTVTLTVDNVTDSGATSLSGALDITINEGTAVSGGAFGSCTGFTAAAGTLASGKLSTLAGATGWETMDVTGTGAAVSTVYKITWALPAGAASTLQGTSTTADFVWTLETD